MLPVIILTIALFLTWKVICNVYIALKLKIPLGNLLQLVEIIACILWGYLFWLLH